MTTQVAFSNAYPIFSTPRRMCDLSAFPMVPRQNHRLSLPPVAILDPFDDDSDDEENLFSYHSLRLNTYGRGRAPSPEDDMDYLEKKKLVLTTPVAVVAQKKPVDTDNKWDYYEAPLSPLSDSTDSEASDSDDGPQSTKTKEVSRTDLRPLSPSPTCLKRKRSCGSGLSSASESVKDPESPSKRRRTVPGTFDGSRDVKKAETSTAARHPLSMSLGEVKKSIRRNEKTFGAVRKPREVGRSQSFRRRGMGTRS